LARFSANCLPEPVAEILGAKPSGQVVSAAPHRRTSGPSKWRPGAARCKTRHRLALGSWHGCWGTAARNC